MPIRATSAWRRRSARQTIDKCSKELSRHLATGESSLIPTALPTIPKPVNVVNKVVPNPADVASKVFSTDALPSLPKAAPSEP